MRAIGKGTLFTETEAFAEFDARVRKTFETEPREPFQAVFKGSTRDLCDVLAWLDAANAALPEDCDPLFVFKGLECRQNRAGDFWYRLDFELVQSCMTKLIEEFGRHPRLGLRTNRVIPGG